MVNSAMVTVYDIGLNIREKKVQIDLVMNMHDIVMIHFHTEIAEVQETKRH